MTIKKSLLVSLIVISLMTNLVMADSKTYSQSTPKKKSHNQVIKTTATAYWSGSCGKSISSRGYGLTASNYKLYLRRYKKHVPWNKAMCVAADPRQFKLGTKLKITFPKPYTVYSGVYTVRDTGGAIKGNILDIYLDSKERCMAFGRQKIKVEVLK